MAKNTIGQNGPKGSKKLLTLPGCGACEGVKKATKGKVKTISVNTKKGLDIAEKLKINKYPHCVDIKKIGINKYKLTKCDTSKFLKKYGIDLS